MPGAEQHLNGIRASAAAQLAQACFPSAPSTRTVPPHARAEGTFIMIARSTFTMLLSSRFEIKLPSPGTDTYFVDYFNKLE
jgi:hypothetical protein